jgi:hypothetical protein
MAVSASSRTERPSDSRTAAVNADAKERPGELGTQPGLVIIPTPSQERKKIVHNFSTTLPDRALPDAINAALIATGHQFRTYRWALVVDGVEGDRAEPSTIALDGHDPLNPASGIVGIFSPRFAALNGGAA